MSVPHSIYSVLKRTLLLFTVFCFSQTVQAQSETIDSIQTGDLIFQSLNGGALGAAIASVTPAYEGHHFTHVGIIYKKDQRVFVIEAIGKEVEINPLDSVLARTSQVSFIGEIKPPYRFLRKKAVQFALQQVGTPYDGDFLINNGKYYCSELVYDAFKKANQGHAVFKLYPMTYKAPGSNHYFPAWKAYFRKKGETIPQGKPGCNPGGLATSGKVSLFPLVEKE